MEGTFDLTLARENLNGAVLRVREEQVQGHVGPSLKVPFKDHINKVGKR